MWDVGLRVRVRDPFLPSSSTFATPWIYLCICNAKWSYSKRQLSISHLSYVKTVQQNKAVVKSSRDTDGAAKTSPRRQQQDLKSVQRQEFGECQIRCWWVLLRWRDLCVAASVPCGRRNITKREKTTFPNVESRFGNRADVTHATLAWKVYPPSRDDVLLFLRTPSEWKFIFFVNFFRGEILWNGFLSLFILCCTHICIENRISAYNSVYTVRSTISLHIVLLFCFD